MIGRTYLGVDLMLIVVGLEEGNDGANTVLLESFVAYWTRIRLET
jgi:hypothetical protein